MHDTVPVTVIAGFLGAGKTTLLNHLLTNAGDRKLAVIVNDFGELDIDRSLIAEVSDDVQSLTNGCICCSIQADLVAQLARLARRVPRPQQILLECSGVSDPVRIARTLGYPELQPLVHLDSIVTLVDPASLERLRDEHARLARAQIGIADLVLINKTDLAEPARVERIRNDWVPAHKRSLEVTHGRVPPALVLDPEIERGADTGPATSEKAAADFTRWTVELDGMFHLQALRAALDGLPPEIFRIKGSVRLAERPDRSFWLQWAGGQAEFRPRKHDTPGETNRLAVIALGREVRGEPLEQALRSALANEATMVAER